VGKSGSNSVNWIFLVLIVGAVVVGAFSGTMHAVNLDGINAAKDAVTLSLGLIGQMTLWLGLYGVLREAGLLSSLARVVRPVMARLFPDVPPDHPAMAAMVMNLSANMLGLANAATPFGLKAMIELDKLNKRRGVATDAMALFLVINNSGVALLQLGVVAVRSIVGSKDPAGVLLPSFFGALVHTAVAITVCKLLQRRRAFAVEKYEVADVEKAKDVDAGKLAEAEASAKEVPGASGVRLVVIALVLAALGLALGMDAATNGIAAAAKGFMSDWVLTGLMVAILLLGMGRKVRVYEAFIPAAKEGFQIGVMIIPYLVAILVAVAMFRASGALDTITHAIGPFTEKVGFPALALPMALVRPLSGSAALAVMTDTMKTNGPDTFVGYLVSMLNGSSETTFYVLSVYFGAVGVRAVRHTMAACLITDAAGIVIATVMCHLFFG
jgi:spore maturation protein SpmA